MQKFILTLILISAFSVMDALAATKPSTASNHSAIQVPDWSLKECQPLAIDSRTTVSQDEARVEDISFRGCHGKVINAFLVGPLTRNSGRHAAIVFVHWYDPAATNSNRSEFLEEAKHMARKGVVSLLVSTFWSVPGGTYQQRRWQDDYDNTLNQTRDLLRAIALLRSLPEVDKKRIAYVGHDYGAAFGAMISSIDTKVKGFALIAGCPRISDWYLYGSNSGVPEGEALLAFRDSFKPIEPVALLTKTKSQILLQYASDDKYISLKDAETMHKAAPKDARFIIYDAVHAMALPQIIRDRREWLRTLLGLTPF